MIYIHIHQKEWPIMIIQKNRFLMKVTAAVIVASMALTPVTAYAEGASEVDATTQDANVEFDDINAADGSDSALAISASSGHTASVTTKDINAADCAGIVSDAENGANTNVTVNGDINVKENSLSLITNNNSEQTVVVNGNIVSTSLETPGISVFSGESAEPDNSTCNITVNGTVADINDSIVATAGSSATNNIVINGNVLSNNGRNVPVSKYTIKLVANEKGTNNVLINGDVICFHNYGIMVSSTAGTAQNNIIIDGTIAYGRGNSPTVNKARENNPLENNPLVDNNSTNTNSGVITEYYNNPGQNNITVWKMDVGCDPYYRRNQDDTAFMMYSQGAEKIQYIIKVDQSENATIKATDANGSSLAKVQGANGKYYEYALQGNKVLLNINVADGYEVDTVYGDKEQTIALTKDESGNYYLMVPSKGGVYFSVKLKIKDDDPDDDPIEVDIAQNNSAVNMNNWMAQPAKTTTVGITKKQLTVFLTDKQIIKLIQNAKENGSVDINIKGTKLSAKIVKALQDRRDLTFNIKYESEKGLIREVVISPKDELILEPDGSLDLTKLL